MVGLPTLQDIVKELENPGIGRTGKKAKYSTFKPDIRTIADL